MDLKETRRSFVRKMFVASQAVMAGGLLPSSVLATIPEPAPAESLKFIVLGDWGRNGELDQTQVAAQMATSAKTLPARFVISVGDNFYDTGVADVHDPQWQNSFEKVYADPALQVPWHVILGNHDYYGCCAAQIAYTKTSSRWHMPARYYQLTQQIDATATADFFFLDTTPMIDEYQLDDQMMIEIRGQDMAAQLDWFKSALAASTAAWKIVVGHHPIYSGGQHGDCAELIRNLLPILFENKIQAYFNGHDHDLQHMVTNDLNMFCTGAGSQVRNTELMEYSRFAKSDSGFTTVSLSARKMVVRMLDSTGTELYATCIPRKS